MPDEKRLLIVGDSHTGTLELGRAALEREAALPRGVEFVIRPLGAATQMAERFWEPREGFADIVDPQYQKRLRRIPPQGSRFDAIGLSMPLWYGRILRMVAAEDLSWAGYEGGSRPISRALMQRLILADQQSALDLVSFLKRCGYPVFVIDPPSVFADNRYFLHLSRERLLGVVAFHRQVLLDHLRGLGIPVVQRPPETVDADGMMNGAFRREAVDDRHHANAAFGAKMLTRIADALPGILSSQQPFLSDPEEREHAPL